MRNTEKAFKWIVEILRKHKVPFQVTGGFAAKLYGSKRELKDIDIDIPEKEFARIVADVKDYITFGPKRYIDKSFNLFLMTLEYQGQEVDSLWSEFENA